MSERIKPHGILVSGKIATGKSTAAEILARAVQERNQHAVVMSTARELKVRFCVEFGLDLEKLLTDRAYKERYRSMLSEWVHRQSAIENIQLFINNIPLMTGGGTVVVNDWRNRDDYAPLTHAFEKTITVRLTATDETRRTRGWIPNPKIDNSMNETALDTWGFDWVVANDGNVEVLTTQLSRIITK